MKTLATLDPRIQEFTNLARAGAEALMKAGQLLVRIVDDNPRAVEDILRAAPDLTPDILHKFLAIGRRTLHPSLVLDDSPAARRLAALPYDEQARLLQARVMVVVRTQDGPMEREKRVCDLNLQEALRVIGDTGIRTVAEQRRLLRPKTRSTNPRASSPPLRHDEELLVEEAEADAAGLAAPLGVTVSLDDDPATMLVRWLNAAEQALLEARSALTMIHKRESPRDRHITAALREVGMLRFAAKEGEV